MGSCSGKARTHSYERAVFNTLCLAIEKDDPEEVTRLVSKHFGAPGKTLDIDCPIVSVSGIPMTVLTYSLTIGAAAAFDVLIRYNSISTMNAQLAMLGTRPIDVICEMGWVRMLDAYLPVYLAEPQEASKHDSQDESLFTEKVRSTVAHEWRPHLPGTPLQKACERGRLDVVIWVWNYFAQAPDEFSVHYIHEFTGENAALCSIKSGNLGVVRFLHEICEANFRQVNKRGESALIVACSWSKRRPKKQFLGILTYLIETVGLDCTAEYEEALLILENPDLIQYYETKLQERGISVSKAVVDNNNRIINRQPTQEELALDKQFLNVREFNFTETFKKELEESNLSSIPLAQSNSAIADNCIDFS